MSQYDPQVQALLDKGVVLHQPGTIEIGPEVDVRRISGDGVVIHNGCRIRGAQTVVSAGVQIGAEGPVTIEDCQLGPNVRLKGGYASRSVFLDGANLGLGHHVRDSSILEEQAGGAHTVGLKQTILFPFVTLGSLINFCDAFMAGGTSRSDHSEVGSSWIHFNFTPTGDKTTPSLFGDVPRGVMLRERPIFLGGQGGAVGPLWVGYGTVVGAGSVLRKDIRTENQLHVIAPPSTFTKDLDTETYPKLASIVAHNMAYLANLDALEAWYRHARRPFFEAQELGARVLDGALDALARARRERLARLAKLAAKLTPENPAHAPVIAALPALSELFGAVEPAPDGVLAPLHQRLDDGYLAAVQGLDADTAAACTAWLHDIVQRRLDAVQAVLPGLEF